METERLTIDALRESDREDYFRNISHDRKVLENFVCTYCERLEDFDFSRYLGHPEYFAIRLRETGKLIGLILYFDEEVGFCEIGYGLGSSFWHKGYATEAVRRFLRYLFLEKGFRTVYASFFTGNEASRHVMEKCGMTYSHFREKEMTYLGRERDLTYYVIRREVFDLTERTETVWENPLARPFSEAEKHLPFTAEDIDDAEARLARFAPFIEKHFPETRDLHGIIESDLTEIPAMRAWLNEACGAGLQGRLFLKRDDLLQISGSVKARGGIYEVLKHSEELARTGGLLGDDYTVFDTEASRALFSRYAIHVGSTGNLGLSIGIMGRAIGYRVYVHMSSDARQWKKELLREKGATVIEYASDYSQAVREGRRMAEEDPFGYFVDDENSRDLFLGYSVAARRLSRQLREKGIAVDRDHPLFVTVPAGVGGAPSGITFGLKECFGDHVRCLIAEPVEAPSMLLGMATGLHDGISVKDIGLSGKTAADGLAVGRPSKFAGRAVEELVSAAVTVKDERLFVFLRALWEREYIFIEPSAAAGFMGAVRLKDMEKLLSAFTEKQLENAVHIVWATGGSMVPAEERSGYLSTPEDEKTNEA